MSVDFPLKFKLTPEANATNNLLAQKFQVDGPPTLIALDDDGKEIWRHIGPYDSPKEFFDDLAVVKSKAK